MDDWEEVENDNIYADESRESQVDDGEISPEEAAFMDGYDSAEGDDSLDYEDEEEKEES